MWRVGGRTSPPVTWKTRVQFPVAELTFSPLAWKLPSFGLKCPVIAPVGLLSEHNGGSCHYLRRLVVGLIASAGVRACEPPRDVDGAPCALDGWEWNGVEWNGVEGRGCGRRRCGH